MKQFQKKFIKTIVADAIAVLFKEAEENFSTHPERTKRYLVMIWSLAKKHNYRLTREQKLKFCKKCFCLWIPSKTVVINFNQNYEMFEFECVTCGHKKRFK